MNNINYKAVFFDLDGTLLPMDLDEFMHEYFNALGSTVASNGLDTHSFTEGLRYGIKAMSEDDSKRKNSEVFWEAFYSIVPHDEARWNPIFEDFYENTFGAVGKNVIANPYAADSVKTLKDKGYPLVLATMPMFPLRAVQWRCSWAGVDWEVFERITHFDNSTSVKPKLAYYEENLLALELKPSEVLMVGNNTKEDLACLELGMDAYLITDHLINPNDFDIETVKHGSFAEFYTWVQSLAPCI